MVGVDVCNNSCIIVTATGIIVAKKIAISFIFIPNDSSIRKVSLSSLTGANSERQLIGASLSLLPNHSDICWIDLFLFSLESDRIFE